MAIPRVRRLTQQDLNTVMQIQGNCYSTSFIEPIEAMAEHIDAGHPCWLIEFGDTPAGYLLAAHMCSDGPPAPISLGSTQRSLPDVAPNWLYLHDLAILPAYQGMGASQAVLAAVEQHAKTLPHLQAMALVAVQDSSRFWAKQGFAPLTPVPEEIAAKLSTYGQQATYMWRSKQIA